MRYFSLCAAVLLGLAWYNHADGQSTSLGKPVRRINLQVLGYGEDDLRRIAFCGHALLFYRNGLPGQRLPLGSCDNPTQDQILDSPGKTHIVARRKEMAIEQVCDQESCSEPPGSPRVRAVKYYLKRPASAPVLLFEEHCLATPPQFLGDEYLLFFRCNLKSVVVNREGKQVFPLPAFTFPYIAVSAGGTRFAVYERDESFFHELAGTTDRVRVSVFQTSNGKKLFKLAWHTKGESMRDGRIALSDDGKLIALIRSGEVLVFEIPIS